MTLGEFEAGAGRGASDLLFVKLDRSISAGIISGGSLQRGARGLAGLIGHSPTGELGGYTCQCGSKGCLEVIAGGDALARDGGIAAQEGRSRFLADMLDRNCEITVENQCAPTGGRARFRNLTERSLLIACVEYQQCILARKVHRNGTPDPSRGARHYHGTTGVTPVTHTTMSQKASQRSCTNLRVVSRF